MEGFTSYRCVSQAQFLAYVANFPVNFLQTCDYEEAMRRELACKGRRTATLPEISRKIEMTLE